MCVHHISQQLGLSSMDSPINLMDNWVEALSRSKPKQAGQRTGQRGGRAPGVVPCVGGRDAGGDVPDLERAVGGRGHERVAAHPAHVRHRLGVPPDHRQGDLQRRKQLLSPLCSAHT